MGWLGIQLLSGFARNFAADGNSPVDIDKWPMSF